MLRKRELTVRDDDGWVGLGSDAVVTRAFPLSIIKSKINNEDSEFKPSVIAF